MIFLIGTFWAVATGNRILLLKYTFLKAGMQLSNLAIWLVSIKKLWLQLISQ